VLNMKVPKELRSAVSFQSEDEKLIKSDVGIGRLAEDIPGFREKYKEKTSAEAGVDVMKKLLN
jgi:hypothetical protein